MKIENRYKGFKRYRRGTYALFPIYLFAVLIFCSPAQAQSVKNISRAVKTVAGHIINLDLTGTWSYSGSAVAFQSDNLLKKAGGAVAASAVENKIDGQLEKLGFLHGVTSFTFNSDGTFTSYLGGRTVSGTYEYDSTTGYLTLKYLNHIPLTAKVTGTSSAISLLMESGGFLSLVSFLGSHSGSSVLGSLTALIGSYDGMMTGIELTRQQSVAVH